MTGAAASHVEFRPTPNPDALRVVAGVRLSDGPPRRFGRGEGADDPIAGALLAIDGVTRILIGRDFVTVVRDGPERDWDGLCPRIASALTALLDRDVPTRIADSVPSPDVPRNEIERQIEEVLERWVRPLLASDGGDAVLDRFDPATGTAWVRMEGACGGCPSGTITLRRGIEQAIRKWVPEVTRVEAANDGAPADPRGRFRDWILARFEKGQG